MQYSGFYPCILGCAAHQQPAELLTALPGTLPSPPIPMRSSSQNNDDHKLAFEQFRDVSVWRRGMDCRVPLTLLLEAAAVRK